ncbi:hypothetical protein ALC60_01218, partial [Trachymyrmex zeteki]
HVQTDASTPPPLSVDDTFSVSRCTRRDRVNQDPIRSRRPMRSRFTFWQLLQTQAPSCLPLRSRYRLPYASEDSGSTYYNYKGQYSTVLMAIVDTSYRFLMVDISAQGRHSDGRIFRNSIIGQ